MNPEDTQERELAKKQSFRDQRKGLRPAATDKPEAPKKRFRKARYVKYAPLFEAMNRRGD